MRWTKKELFMKRLPEIEEWARQGYSEKEMIELLGTSSATFYKYKAQEPALREALERGYNYSIPKVIPALYKAAIGYRYTEQTRERNKDGDLVVTKEVEKEVPPNVSAIMNILKNKMPEKWLVAEKFDINVRNENKQLEQLTNEQLEALIDMIGETENGEV